MGRKGGTNERPGTNHMTSGPMRGLTKSCSDGAKPHTHTNTHTHTQTDMATL